MERKPTVWPYIKSVTQDEIDNVIPLVSKGWASQTKEFDTYEFTKENSTLQGDIPTDLRGTFIRNGPGLNDVFGVPLLHPIDGDGMIVQVSFENGRACLKSRYVNTFSHVAEQKAKKMLHPGQMGTKVPGQTKPAKWRDPSHTNVFSWGGKLVACHEYALPHAMDPISMETLGEDTMKGNLSKIRTLGAHFRYDADLDLLVTVSFRPGGPIESGVPPQLEIHEFDRQWNAVRKTVCSIPGMNYAHDLLVTPDFYIVQMTPFIKVTVESMKEIKDGKLGPGQQMRYHPDLPSKMIVIERDLQKKVNIAPRYVALDAEPCHIYHFANCRQSTAVDGSTVIRFDACCLPPGFTMDWQHKAFLSNTADAPGVMQHYEIVLGAKEMYCKRTMIDELKEFSCEFPTTHPYRHCLRDPNVSNRYTYIMSSQPGVALPFTCVVKHDAVKKSTTRWNAEGVVGEPCFIPRLGYASAKYGEEDDGYVIVQHYLYKEGRTEFCILDAKNVQGGPVCRLKLPERIPFGFHGTYTPEVFIHPKAKL